ncbi:MAG: hypothetical protein V3S71_07750, partial [Acidobacteriota bacterium]
MAIRAFVLAVLLCVGNPLLEVGGERLILQQLGELDEVVGPGAGRLVGVHVPYRGNCPVSGSTS